MIYTIVRKDKNDVVDAVISFDSISSMEESWTSTVTSQPVEYGFNITDNINIEAPTFSITAILSSYSLFDMGRELIWDGEDFVSSGGEVNRNSHVDARDELLKIFKERSIVTVVESEANSNVSDINQRYTDLKVGHYKETDSCVITGITVNHPNEGHGAFIVAMTIQNIQRAYVSVSELAEDEKVPMLRPLSQVYQKTTSSQSTSEGDVDPVSGLPKEPDEEVEDSTEGNRAKVEKEKRAALGIDESEDYLEAVKRATYRTQTTGKTHTVIRRGKNYVVIKGRNAAALMTVEGVTDW